MAHADVLSFFGNTIDQDIFHILCGKVLGIGVARTVYECRLREDLVVKIETPVKSFQNVNEWLFWEAWNTDKDISRWLAPCVDISPCGTTLLQKRTATALTTKYPAMMPKFLTDLKRSNYGMYKGKLVCHDYGLVIASAYTGLRKAKWWQDDD